MKSCLLGRIALVAVLSMMVGCSSSKRASDYQPWEYQDKAFLFGKIHIIREGKDVTQGASVTFADGPTYVLEGDGFVAAGFTPDKVTGVESFEVVDVPGDYRLPNLVFKIGKMGTASYIGDIVINIQALRDVKQTPIDSWTWVVQNRGEESLKRWKQLYGQRPLWRYLIELGHREGQEVPQARSLSQDPDSPVVGF